METQLVMSHVKAPTITTITVVMKGMAMTRDSAAPSLLPRYSCAPWHGAHMQPQQYANIAAIDVAGVISLQEKSYVQYAWRTQICVKDL